MPTEPRPHVALVTPSFFGYESDVAAAFEAGGARVSVVDERPDNGSVTKALARVAPWLMARRLRRYYEQVEKRLTADPPDLLVVVKAEVVPVSLLRAVRRANPACVLAFYTFDTLTANRAAASPRAARILDEFDHTFSFDRDDAAEFGLTYKPLFHTADYAAARRGTREHDLVFVGTVHSGRWAICRRLFAATRDNDGFFFSPARWHHALQWLLHGDVRRIPWSDVSFTKLSRTEVAARFAGARGVVDVQRSGQTGLTMRTFEVLAAGSGLVTTNTAIVDEPFYDPRWVHVLAGEPASWDLDAVAAFVASEPGAPAEVLAPYALGAWVEEFLALLPAARAVA